MDAFTSEAAAPAASLENSQTGGFGLRFGGRLIDWVAYSALGFVGGIIGGVMLAILAAAGRAPADWVSRVQSATLLQNMGWGLLAGLLYHTLSEGIGGTSLGKLVLGLRVVTPELEPCPPASAALRSLGYFVDALFFGLPAHSSMKGSPLNQRLGDKWAKTVVARAAALPPRALRSGGLVALGLFAGMTANVLCMVASVLAKAY